MTSARRTLNVALIGLGIAAQQIFAAAAPLPLKSHSSASKKNRVMLAASRSPIPPPGYVAQIRNAFEESGAPTVLIDSSPDKFNADERGTAASHVKLLSILAVFKEMDRNPGFADQVDPACGCTNWELVRRTWISSDNIAAQVLVRQIAPVHTDEGVTTFLNNFAQEIGLSKQFQARNASGNPDYPIKHGHADSYSTPNDEERIGFELAKYKDRLLQLARSAGTVPTDAPTNGLFYPLANRNDRDDGYVLVCKTGTDRFQNHSTLWILMTPDNKVLVGYHRHPKTGAAPIAAAAKFIMNAMDKAQIDNPLLRTRLEQFAEQRIAPNDVGAPAGFLHEAGRIYRFAPPVRVQFASLSVTRAHKNHGKPRRHKNPSVVVVAALLPKAP